MSLENQTLTEEIEAKYKLAKDWRSANNLETEWNTAKDNYEGTSEATKNREAAGRSAVFPHWPTTAVDQLTARFVNMLFGRTPYFTASPLNKKAVEKVKVGRKLLYWQLFHPTAFEQIVRTIQGFLIYGFSVLKLDWDFDRNNIRVQDIDIRNFYFSPASKFLNNLRWAIHKCKRSLKELELENQIFRERYGEDRYTNLEELKEAHASLVDTENEYTQKEAEDIVVMLEYWDKDKKVLLAKDEKIIIQNVKNPVGFIPFICFSDVPTRDSILGRGEPKSIETPVAELATIKNQRIDNVNLALQPPWLRNINIDILNEDQLSNICPGLVIDVDVPPQVDPNLALRQMEIRDVTAGSYNEAELLERDIRYITGLHDPVIGGVSSKRMTLGEHMGLREEGSQILRFKLMWAIKSSFILLPGYILAWDRKYLDKKTIVDVTGEEQGAKAFLEVSKKDLPHPGDDVEFIEQVTAADIEATKEYKRSQLLQALQILAQMKQLDPRTLERLTKAILDTFEMPELSKAMEKPIEEREPENNLQAMIQNLVRQGTIPRPGEEALSAGIPQGGE